MFMSNGIIQVTIFLLHTWFQTLQLNIQSHRYLDPHDHIQPIHCRLYLMQHSLTRNVLVQQLLRQVQYACYHSV